MVKNSFYVNGNTDNVPNRSSNTTDTNGSVSKLNVNYNPTNNTNANVDSHLLC